jgi:hypothetical protein
VKKIIILLMTTVLAVGAYAQEEKSALSKFYGGVRVGFTATQISGDDLSGFHQLGGTAGLFVNHAVNPTGRLKLQLELNFTMKGSHSKAPKNQMADNFYSLRLGYVEMPLMLIWTAGKWQLWGQQFQFDLEIGPCFGVNVFTSEREANGPIVGRPPFRWYEFSGIAGITLNIAEHHSANFRYSNSIIPVRIPTWVYDRVVYKQFNSVMTFSYCYQF